MTDLKKILGPDDPAPFEIVNAQGRAPVLVTCEHAGVAVPRSLGRMGLEDADFEAHYAYDPGARDVALALARMLDAPAILGVYSRMVADIGRRRDDTAFPTVGEGKAIPANRAMSEAEKEARFQEIYDPYHNALTDLLDRVFPARGVVPAVVSIHSYTPVFHGEARPWEVGVLWVQDARIPVPLMEHFRQCGYVVGDNAPYDLRALRGIAVVDRYADARNLPNVMVEFRNDLIRTPQDVARHTQALYDGLAAIFKDEGVFTPYDGPRLEQGEMDDAAREAYFAKVMRTMAADKDTAK